MISFGLRFSFLKFLVKENEKMFCLETALVGTKHFPKDLFSLGRNSQGHPRLFSVIKNICSSKQKSRIFYSLRKAKKFPNDRSDLKVI